MSVLSYVNPFFPVYLSENFLKYISFCHNSCLLQKESLNSDDQPGFTFEGDSGEEVALWSDDQPGFTFEGDSGEEVALWSDDQPGFTFEGDSGEEITLWRLTSLSCWSKTKFKSASTL